MRNSPSLPSRPAPTLDNPLNASLVCSRYPTTNSASPANFPVIGAAAAKSLTRPLTPDPALLTASLNWLKPDLNGLPKSVSFESPL